ncbi:ribbon-helix-helix protein, CopG family [Glaesserella parasuis]|uniref:ribbon-helix-helix protein, CopG family n=1 Tax=Glaesserella parasuis TaxID=738 RepID=UPI0024366CA4|nr:ribbon-helix-helix protein, CopG family [Glaesserella parasuis]MDG6359260.1 ribbon-helix-helix protein, CopG family [Glaesserella parasuis]
MTEISEQLRKRKIATARQFNDKALQEGKARRILMQLPSEVADEFDAICAEMGVSRPQAIKALCALYRGK